MRPAPAGPPPEARARGPAEKRRRSRRRSSHSGPVVVLAHPDPRNPGGITAVVASLRAGGLDQAVEVVELHTSAMGSSRPLKLAQAARAVIRLLLLLGRDRPDLVHLHASTGASLVRKLALAWCCRLARTPYIAHEHSGELEAWIGSSTLRRAAARSLYGHAAAVIVLGERWRAPLEALGARRVEVLANGLSQAERARLAAPRPPQPAGPKRRKVLLFYGRWTPKKGPDRLAAALTRLGRTDYELRIFGTGEREWIQSLFDGVGGEVLIGGWLGPDRKPIELAAAAALLAPSRAEGFPVALVEARAAGTPIIATDVGAAADALAGYERGRLIDDGDEPALAQAIETLLDDHWPPAGQRPFRGEVTSELPPALRSECAIERLLEIYRDAGLRC